MKKIYHILLSLFLIIYISNTFVAHCLVMGKMLFYTEVKCFDKDEENCDKEDLKGEKESSKEKEELSSKEIEKVQDNFFQYQDKLLGQDKLPWVLCHVLYDNAKLLASLNYKKINSPPPDFF